MSEHVHVDTEHRVTTVTLDRPAAKNALTPAMYQALSAALAHAADDPQVRAVLIRGAGGVFTSGNDVGSFAADIPERWQDSDAFRFVLDLFDFPKPVVAAVDGYAIGVGATLLLHCDLVYATADAVVRFPFVDLGLVPEAGSSLLLPQLVGRPRAASLLLSGETLDGATAADWGLINGTVAAEELHPRALEAAKVLARKPPAALRNSRALMRQHDRQALRAHMNAEAQQFFAALRAPEAKEAVGAFLQRRAPDFSRFE